MDIEKPLFRNDAFFFQTLELLQKFQEKVRSAHQGSSEKKTKEALDDDEDEEDIKGDDWYEINYANYESFRRRQLHF